MVPLKSLLLSVAPLPAKVLLELPAARARANEFGLTPGSAVTPALIAAALVDRAGGLLAGADLLDDLHREGVADQARAVVLEQRPVAGAWKMEPLAGGAGQRLRGHRGRRCRPSARAGHVVAHRGSSRRAAPRRPSGQHCSKRAHHSCPSRCSIWSEVWMALEFSS
jgi:hypothetical protein